jgi:hypothetical protein
MTPCAQGLWIPLTDERNQIHMQAALFPKVSGEDTYYLEKKILALSGKLLHRLN